MCDFVLFGVVALPPAHCAVRVPTLISGVRRRAVRGARFFVETACTAPTDTRWTRFQLSGVAGLRATEADVFVEGAPKGPAASAAPRVKHTHWILVAGVPNSFTQRRLQQELSKAFPGLPTNAVRPLYVIFAMMGWSV